MFHQTIKQSHCSWGNMFDFRQRRCLGVPCQRRSHATWPYTLQDALGGIVSARAVLCRPSCMPKPSSVSVIVYTYRAICSAGANSPRELIQKLGRNQGHRRERHYA